MAYAVGALGGYSGDAARNSSVSIKGLPESLSRERRPHSSALRPPQGLSSDFLDWLLLEDSMTKRFEQHCRKVTVRIVREGFVPAGSGGTSV